MKKGQKEDFNHYTTININPAVLGRIYMEMKRGTFWFPNAEYVEVSGIYAATR